MKPKPVEEIWGIPLRRHKNLIGFFGRDGLWKEVHISEFEKIYTKDNHFRNLDSPLARWKDDLFYDTYSSDDYSDYEFGRSVQKAVTQMTVGDTYDDFLEKYKNCQEHFRKINEFMKGHKNEMHQFIDPIDINRFVTKIFRPTFIRLPDNPRKKSFDIIKVGVDTCTEWPIDPKQFLKANIKEVINMVLEKIKKSQSFKSYGVPIGCLALTNIVKCGNAYYEFIFELKKELRSEENYGNESK
jgi:hypothetical protein